MTPKQLCLHGCMNSLLESGLDTIDSLKMWLTPLSKIRLSCPYIKTKMPIHSGKAT